MNEAWVVKNVDAPLIAKVMPLGEEGTLLNIFFFNQRALCYRNHARQERASQRSTTETVFFRN